MVRSVWLFSVGLALMALIGVCGAGAAPEDTASAAVTAAGQPSECEWKDELTCSCTCSPLAGSWIASLFPKEYEEDAIGVTGGKDGDSIVKKVKPVLKTFKFAPVNDKCDKFVLNAQAVTMGRGCERGFSHSPFCFAHHPPERDCFACPEQVGYAVGPTPERASD